MTRKDAIASAKKRLAGSEKLTGLLAKFGKVRVFPVGCGDYVTFKVAETPVLLAEYQGGTEVA